MQPESEEINDPIDPPDPVDPNIGPNFKLTLIELLKRTDLLRNPLTVDKYYEDWRFLTSPVNLRTKESLKQNKITRVNFESLNLENHEDTNSAEVLGTTTQSPISSVLEDKLYLDNFFERPVRLFSIPIPLKTEVFTISDVWNEWSMKPAIRNKLAHYSFFRGNMKLRFSLSTTKFHYGSLLISYQPLHTTNRIFQAVSLFPNNAPGIVSRNCYLSQSPQICYVNAGQDDDVQLNLPFIHPMQSLKLFNTSSPNIINNATPYNDFISMGRICISTLAQFHSQSTVVEEDPILTIYAWMENVDISGPTNTRIDVDAESEFMTNPISTVATSISNVAEKLEDIPVISTFAKATTIAATAISKIALMFGFSKPLNVEPPSFAKQVLFSNGATIVGRDTAYKLSCDPKQEVALMNDICGSGNHDSLAHKYLTSIPTLIDTRAMSNKVPYTDNYIELPITPMIGPAWQKSTQVLIQMTPLSQVAMLYNFWRGTISYRFDFTASSFTRGKLVFIYEPNGTTSYLDRRDRATILNQQYITTLDLEKDRSITIDVGFHHDKVFAKCYGAGNFNEFGPRPVISIGTYNHLAENIVSCISGKATGIITVRNATTITGVTPTDPMYMHTFISSKDMEFAEPYDHSQSTLIAHAESSYTQDEPINKVQVQNNHTVDVSGLNTIINRVKPSNDKIYLSHFGEKIESIRVLLKRDQVAFVSFIATGNTVTHGIYPPAGFPLVPGIAPTFGDAGKLNTFNIMRYCYLGMRGGIRYRVISTGDRISCPAVVTYKRNNVFNPVISPSSFVGSVNMPLAAGGIVQSPILGIEYEIPYKHNHFFDSPSVHNNHATLGRDINASGAAVMINDVPNNTSMAHLMSIAEDFNFIRFQGAGFYKILGTGAIE